jgi:DNA-binding transcriptional MerR regulator
MGFNVNKLDKEWLELIRKAKELGLTIKEVQEFLKKELVY